ncbi:nuclear pore complex protein Nup133-like [Clavelina lepadiformis]|uniref:nuclear pore complex protein Nup133-like n=1 Tax=Clavelina lepadiformis TaxID=159417 RepID=UPI004042CA06
MFTPSRKRSSNLPSNRRSAASLTPRAVSSLRNTSRTSLLRKSLVSRNSPAGNTTLFSSPTITTAFTSTHHTLQAYESSLPVLVTEAITLAEDISEISVKINAHGWCWLVCELKLFVWTNKQTSSKIPICKEIPLRPVAKSDDYDADLVSVDHDDRSGNLMVTSVSLNGKVTHWANILVTDRPNAETEVVLPTQIDQCFNITYVQQHGFILSTIHGTFFHLYPLQSVISWKQLQTSKGTIAGISRRVSSFFFSSAAQTDNVLQVFCVGAKVQGEYEVIVLSQTLLQRWKVVFSNGKETLGPLQMTAEIDLVQILLPRLSNIIWHDNKPSAKMWPVDARQATKHGAVAVLVAITESVDSSSLPMHYAVCVIPNLNNLNEINVILLQHTRLYSKNSESELLSYELVVDNPIARSLQHFAIWCSDKIILRSVASGSDDIVEDNVPFNSPGDRILGAGQCDGQCIFLSALNDLITSSCSFDSHLPSFLEESILNTSNLVMQSPPQPSRSMSSIPGTPVMTQAKMEQLESSENCAQRLQAAFLYYCRLNLEQAQSLVSEAFSTEDAMKLLDSAVECVSCNLIDDYPAQDPRWAESVPRDVAVDHSASTGSMILLHQLEDKQKAHSLFLKFLAEVNIWSRLSFIRSGRDKTVTRWKLSEHAEKLQAAISLVQKHPSHQVIVDASIRRALDARGKLASITGLTQRDFFYREVSKVDEIFEYLLEEEEKLLMKSSLSSREKATIISGVNSVFESMLGSARHCRKAHALEDADRRVERIPWTVKSGHINIRNTVIQQHKRIVERGILEAEDSQQKAILYQSLVNLADLILDGYQEQLMSLSFDESKSSRKAEVKELYEMHRLELIGPILAIGQKEKAAFLAEKYHDFDILVTLCDESHDHERMKPYMRRFAAQGFAKFLFNWYLERKEYRKLLSCCDDDMTNQQELKVFLKHHPKLAWMHQVKSGDYLEACDTLKHIADHEKDSAMNKKNYLSLGKLAAVFSDNDKETIRRKTEVIDHEQMLLKYQETLPSSVYETLTASPDCAPVYSPTKLIELYIGDLNQHANEVDFKKAFELLDYITGDSSENTRMTELDEWKLHIWCRAILKDNWQDVDTSSDPFESCSHTVLFKTLKLAYDTDTLPDIMPEVNSLLGRSELEELGKDPKFEFLMRASFERVQRMMVPSTA